MFLLEVGDNEAIARKALGPEDGEELDPLA
jgi:hypothetical protein